MYAIIADGGKQYRVAEGQEIVLDYRDAAKGTEVTFDRILAVSGDAGLQVGVPTVAGATVTGEVLGPVHGEKLVVQKFRRRKNYRRKNGHRQWHTKVRISKIQA